MSTLSPTPRVSTESYKQFASWIEENCGISLGDSKMYLVESRLAPILVKLKCQSFDELVSRLKSMGAADLSLKEEIIDAMTTNETLWFRDPNVWNFLEKDFLPEVLAAATGRYRIWSAAASSGQEIYSMAMLLKKLSEQKAEIRNNALRAELMATDVSSNIIQIAQKGKYSRLEMSRGLSEEYKRKYFDKDRLFSLIKREIKSRVHFKTLNLQNNFSSLGKFDMILCRNVTIYFSKEFRQDLLERLEQSLNPGGVLILGASESIIGFQTKLKNRPGSPPSFYFKP